MWKQPDETQGMGQKTSDKRTSLLAHLEGHLGRIEEGLRRWEDAKPGRGGCACYHAYNALFPLFALLVLVSIPLGGRELIWNVDGLNQYYPFFVYEGQWVRSVVSGLLSGNGVVVPLWEWCSGYGADIPTTFDVFLDPLNLVSAITPESLSEWVFQALVVMRLYLAGLSFTYYCRTRGENRTGTVLGALLYALCGAGLTVIRWPSGLHALILFPIVLAGAERVLSGKRPWVFVASLTALAVVSYYFAFMACVLLVPYLALRVIMTEGPRLTVARFLRWVATFAGLVLLCLALAGFAIVPAAVALAGMGRVVDQSTVVPLLYPATYYVQLLSGFLSTHDVGSDTYQGFGGLAFLACALLFARRGENRELKLVFVVLSLLFFLPCVGSFLNGLNYATNRWAWAYAMCVALVLVRATPGLLSLDTGERGALAVSVATYALLFLIPAFRTEANVAGLAALLAAFVILLVARGHATARGLLGCALALTLAVNGFYFLAADEGGIGGGQVPLGMGYAKLTSDSADSLALEAEDDPWWRYDAGQTYSGAGAPIARIRNNSLVLGLRGIDFYNSVYNGYVDAFHTELAIAGDEINFSYSNLQGRSDLMSLLGVKYYVFRNDGTDAAPFGFDETSPVARRPIMSMDYSLLRGDSPLPPAFVLDHSISRSDYLELSPIRRQQALLQAVVLEDGAASTDSSAGATPVSTSRLTFEDSTLPFDVLSTSAASIEDGRIVASAAGASITLRFEGVPRADTYLFLKGLSYRGLRPSELVPEEQKQAMRWYYRANLLLQDLSWESPLSYEIAAKTDVSSMTGYITNYVPSYHMYGGKETWLLELGYSEHAARQVTLTFSAPGEYTFDEMSVEAQTHERRAEWLDRSLESTLENMEFGQNRLAGSVDLAEPGTLLVTVAYSKGWSATVDGSPAELKRADTAFMALDLSEGHHDIELRYLTPGLVEGLALTGIAALAVAALAVALRWRDRGPNVQTNGRTVTQ